MRRLFNYLSANICDGGDWLAFLDDMGRWKPKRWFGVALGILGVGLFFFSFAWLLGLIQGRPNSEDSGVSFSNFGPVGDYFGGMMAPFIGLIGAILTFAAFYVQFKANEDQKKLLRKQAKEIKKQQAQIRIDRFEQRFFEMLRIHRENAATMMFEGKPFQKYSISHGGTEWGDLQPYKHHKVIEVINVEVEAVFRFLQWLMDRQLLRRMTAFETANWAYEMVFVGRTSAPAEWELPEDSTRTKLEQRKLLEASVKAFIERGGSPLDYINDLTQDVLDMIAEVQGAENAPKMLQGYVRQLSSYYRHMFLMVDELEEFKEDGFTDDDRKRYAKLLRAQLTDEDELLLYYNSLWIGVGDAWWNRGFMTKYDFIKHVPRKRIPKEISPELRMEEYLKFLEEKKSKE